MVQIRRVSLRREFPQAGVLVSLRGVGFDGNRFPIHCQLRMRVFEEIQIPVRVLFFPPVRRDDQIFPFVKEISNRDHARLSRFSPDGFEQEDGLCAEFGADPSAGDADEEAVDVHE